MKRKFTKLMAALALLTFLAVPLGMWGQANVTLTQSSLELTGSYTTNTEKTIDGITYVYTDLMKNSDNIQAKASTGTIKNSTAYSGDIISVAITHSGTARATTINGSANGTDWVQVATGSGSITADFSGKGYKYFQITRGSNAAYWTQIVITYSGTPTYTLTSAVTPTGTGTVALSETSLGEGGTATATATANAHYTFTSWSITGGGATLSSTTTNPTTVTMGAANATITATFIEDPKYNITYNPNYEGSTDEPVVVSNYAGETMTIAPYNTFSRTGYAITSWNTQADGNGTTYNAGDSYTMTSTGLTLYAQWEVSYETVDVLDRNFTGVNNGGGYTAWSNKVGASGAVYAGRSGGSNNSIQLNNTSPNGIVSTTSGGKVTKVVITWNSNTSNGRSVDIYGSNTAYEGSADLYDTDKQGTKLGSIVKGTSTTLTISGDYTYIGIRNPGSAVYLEKVEITWSTAPSTAPSITAENVNIAYNAEEGNIQYEIVNPVEGASIQALLADGATITNFVLDEPANGAVHFTCDANATNAIKTATVTLNYVSGDATLATKDVTVTQAGNPNVFDNISDINTVGTDYIVKGTVVATNSRGFIIGDGTGYVYTYLNDVPTFEVNDMVTVSGTMGNHNHVLQFTSSATVAAATSSSYNGTPAVTVITEIPDYTQSDHLSTYLQFEGELTKSSSNYFITVGEEDIQISYPSTAQTTTLNDLDGKTVRVKGYFAAYNSSNYFTVMMESIEEVTDPYITIESDAFELTANEEEGYLEITYGNFTPISFDIMYCDANGNELSDNPEWITLAIETPAGEEGDFVYYDVEPNGGAARTAYFKVYASLGEGQETVYSNLVAITQAAYENPNCTWDLSIASYASASENQVSWTSNFATMTIDKGESTTNANNYLGGTNNRTSTRFYTSSILTLSPVSGYVITSVVFTATTSGYANALGNSTWTNATASVNETVVTVTPTDGAIAMSATIGATCGFTQVKVYYLPAYRLTINGYTGEKDHYFLIASPVTVDPANVEGMTTGDFDLYYFDQAQEDEWRNYEVTPFNLVPGTGYLYAKKATTETPTYNFTLAGAPYSGNGQITLSKVDRVDWEGWNLIGNPYATGMVLKDANNGNKAFYTLNPAGNELMGGEPGATIAAMEGVFVEATTDGEEVSFVEETGGGGAGGGGFDFISLNVSRNRGASAGSATIDRAIIGIGEGPMLHKFQLNPSNTKIYITEANQDYAIVRSANEGEQPVSFRASENGTYTLSVEVNNIEMDYLHLIDNMTGADVDLLATPSYTFEAKTSDYASRFRLVFSANSISEDADGDNAFAYFNGSSWTISNMGEATLQVVDVMGRVLSSETLSGNAEVNINQPTGVYMLRLVSGDSVKVQKVVVR